MAQRTKNNGNKPGPKPDSVKIKGDWEAAMGQAMKKKRPPGGWPDSEKVKKPKKN